MNKRMIVPVFLLLLMAAILSITATAAEIVDSGYCGGEVEGDNYGKNLSWVLTRDGTLTISGSGKMDNYHSNNPVPWYDNRASIKTGIIENGVISISGAFDNCSELTSVTIPNSVTEIGAWTFANCDSLVRVVIPDSVISIGYCAFGGCSRLTSVIIPDSITSIDDHAFSFCRGLTNVTIPASVTSIGERVFESCSNLISVNVQTENTQYSSEDGVLFTKHQFPSF